MFHPSREQVRQFFCETWRLGQHSQKLSPLQNMAYRIMNMHPDYQVWLPCGDAPGAVVPDDHDTNPFLHLSLHLSLEEQLQIDQPLGIRSAWRTLLGHGHDEHSTMHLLMNALAATLDEAQRTGCGLSSQRYMQRIAHLLERKGRLQIRVQNR